LNTVKLNEVMKTFANPSIRLAGTALSAGKAFAGFTFLNAIRRPIACAGLVFLFFSASAAQAQTALPYYSAIKNR
jgi:hypothetical protein